MIRVDIWAIIIVVFCIAIIYYSAKLLGAPQLSANRAVQLFNALPNKSGEDVSAFTAGRASAEGSFIVYRRNNESGAYEKAIETSPVYLDGTEYSAGDHGIFESENEQGFRLRGVEPSILCPDQWRWNTQTQRCEVVGLCEGKASGTIAGLNRYNFDQIFNRSTVTSKFHPRVYAICDGNGGISKLDYCTGYSIFDESKDGTLYSRGQNPCLVYDRCEDLVAGSTFQEGAQNSNQYYQCEDGVSVAKTCPDGLVFDTSVGGCLTVDPCLGLADGTQISYDSTSFVTCNGGRSVRTSCVNGTTVGTSGTVECVTSACVDTPRLTTSNSSRWFTYNDGGVYCVSNQPTTVNCGSANVESISHPNDAMLTHKASNHFYDETITRWNSIATISNGTIKCTDITSISDQPEPSDKTVYASYADFVQQESWNFWDDRIAEFAPIYYNYFGQILYLESDNGVVTTFGNASNYMPLLSSTFTPIKFTSSQAYESTVDSILGVLDVTVRIGDSLDGAVLLCCYCFAIKSVSNNVSRMLVSSKDGLQFLIFDVPSSLLYNPLLMQIGYYVERSDIPYNSWPSASNAVIPEETGLYARGTTITGAKRIVAGSSLVTEHWVSLLQVPTSQSLIGNIAFVGTIARTSWDVVSASANWATAEASTEFNATASDLEPVTLSSSEWKIYS